MLRMWGMRFLLRINLSMYQKFNTDSEFIRKEEVPTLLKKELFDNWNSLFSLFSCKSKNTN